jgi:hypothetical protein
VTYLSKHTKCGSKGSKCSGMGDGDPVGDLLALFDGVIPADKADPADNVNQTVGGGVSTSASDFTSAGGVCKPMNFPALAASRALQSQLNRVAQMKGFGKVATDGAIGPGTLALFRQVQSISAGGVMGDASNCMGVAPDVDVLAGQVQSVADSLGAPATVSGPVLSLSVPTIKTKSGKTVAAPDSGLLGSMASMSGLEKLALLGVAGGIGYLLLSKKKRRK